MATKIHNDVMLMQVSEMCGDCGRGRKLFERPRTQPCVQLRTQTRSLNS